MILANISTLEVDLFNTAEIHEEQFCGDESAMVKSGSTIYLPVAQAAKLSAFLKLGILFLALELVSLLAFPEEPSPFQSSVPW